ncbi:MAG: hypothetical protein ACJLTB_21005 [Algoriphagus aquaeductus]|uniref:hypothetical protein n=1 Tax=Algoriphagus aquaeductus TaxID=475299 RepID=UPI00387A4789
MQHFAHQFVLLDMKHIRLISVFTLFFSFCTQFSFAQKDLKIDSVYLAGIPQGVINNPILEEISGLAFSQKHPNLIYVHTDSGGEAAVYLLDSLGKELGVIELEGVKNRDWEDIAVGPGPGGKPYVFVAEIGDNAAIHSEICIIRFPEPNSITANSTVKPEVLRLTYPGGARDAETLMVDPISGDLFIVSKRDDKNTLYRVPQSAFSKGKATLEKLHNLDFTSSVAGDISSDGSKILIKNYFTIYYWERKTGESIPQALQRVPKRLPYVPEPQGEAIGFNPSGNSFFTISEKRFNIHPTLYRFPKRL